MSTNRQVWKHACNSCSDNHEGVESFLQQIVTANGTCLHHTEPASKHQIMELKHIIAWGQEIEKCALCQQIDVDTVLGLQ